MKLFKILILIAISWGMEGRVYSQNIYWIGFVDKSGTTFSVNHPEEFLSSRAIGRRLKQNINITSEDLPVSNPYVDSLKKYGATIHFTLKWPNGAVIAATDEQLQNINKLALVNGIKLIFDATIMSSQTPMEYLPKTSNQNRDQASKYGYGQSAIEMVKGNYLHDLGYTGKNMLIAVIDAGFYHANIAAELQPSFANGRIIVSKDFVTSEGNIYEEFEHGTNVLSVMASNTPTTYIGTAPLASYLLLRSENVNSEQLLEEYTWAKAAEFADSAGTDIINSSLGYTTFDAADQNHSYSDLTGTITPISKACSIAASKGILIINAAGNDGNKKWNYINAPADSYGILTVGAVNSNLLPASFTSHGPSADGRIKPEVAALGISIPVVGGDGTIRIGSGTSFASPVIAGISACLWQAFPSSSAQDIRSAIIESSSQFKTPNDTIGFGVPNMESAFKYLLKKYKSNNCQEPDIHPNPFFDGIYITISHPTSPTAIVNLYSTEARKIASKTISVSQDVPTLLPISNELPTGIYIVEVVCGDCRWTEKLVKQQLK